MKNEFLKRYLFRSTQSNKKQILKCQNSISLTLQSSLETWEEQAGSSVLFLTISKETKDLLRGFSLLILHLISHFWTQLDICIQVCVHLLCTLSRQVIYAIYNFYLFTIHHLWKISFIISPAGPIRASLQSHQILFPENVQ